MLIYILLVGLPDGVAMELHNIIRIGLAILLQRKENMRKDIASAYSVVMCKAIHNATRTFQASQNSGKSQAFAVAASGSRKILLGIVAKNMSPN